LIFRGVRGSFPTADPKTSRYGGHTACLELVISPSHRLLIDCGSGLVGVDAGLRAGAGVESLEFDVFLTHYHMDHLQGLPFFAPLHDARGRFRFHGFPSESASVREAIEGFLQPPWFPVPLTATPSQKSYVELDARPVRVADVTVTAARLNHPQGITGYRLQRGPRAIVFATDVERGDPGSDGALRALAQGAEVLVHDAQYTPDEYGKRRGWGHSTWRHALEAAGEAGVRTVVLYHHDPERSDDEIDAIVREARAVHPGVVAAREGMTLEL
jgi:phosphoribosyl 1,2-cyclic phosphodiesterase